MTFEQGKLILYQSDDGQTMVDVQLKDETVWLTQANMTQLFERDQSVISRHVNNIFTEGELERQSNMQKMHIAHSDKSVAFYNLNVIISVGYRVKSQRGTQFRIWATSVLKDHLVKGYTLNQKRLAEKGVDEARQMLALVADTLEGQQLVGDEGLAVLDIVTHYAKTWQFLWQYDEDTLPVVEARHRGGVVFELDEARMAIATLRRELMSGSQATEIFGNERNNGLAGIIGAVHQTFGGLDLYPGVEEKAANLLYFIIKDHPFTDGNKRIGSFVFLLFLKKNGLLDVRKLDNKALVALTLLTASSDPSQKDLIIRLVVNLLSEE
jgi:prophage maintenance system killer protein